jgi:hypothetical protein
MMGFIRNYIIVCRHALTEEKKIRIIFVYGPVKEKRPWQPSWNSEIYSIYKDQKFWKTEH